MKHSINLQKNFNKKENKLDTLAWFSVIFAIIMIYVVFPSSLVRMLHNTGILTRTLLLGHFKSQRDKILQNFGVAQKPCIDRLKSQRDKILP